jgi:hypothetical protein
MKSISNVNPHDFLERCEATRVEHRTMDFEGRQYAIPYSTIQIGEDKLEGLRENEERIDLLRNIISNNAASPMVHLDIGSNLGVFVESLKDMFEASAGVDADPYYIDQCHFLYPDTESVFHLCDLNETTLGEKFDGLFDVITALSMLEYIKDKETFITDLYKLTDQVCIVEGHSEDVILPGFHTLSTQSLVEWMGNAPIVSVLQGPNLAF